MINDGMWWLEPTYSLGSHRSFYVECYVGPPLAKPETLQDGEVPSRIISTGTAFIVRYKERRYIVTNRHIVTGKDNRNQPLSSKTGLVPDHLLLRVPWLDPQDRRSTYNIQVKGPEDQPQFWWQHPELGAKVDVAVIPLFDHLHPEPPVMEGLGRPIKLDYPLEDSRPYRHALPLHVTQELYVIGYPAYADPTKTSNTAVWTRGTIASEPHIGFDGAEAFLLDARTRKGQSGSPVIRHEFVKSRPETRQFPSFESDLDALVGVYSGRIDESMDIGFVWPTFLIREIIEGEYKPTYRDLMPLD